MPYGRCASTLIAVWRLEWESAHVAFDAAELKLPELGYMVENKVLQWGLWQALAAHEAVTLRVGSELKTMQRGETQTALHLREGRRSTPGWLSAPTALPQCGRWPASACTPGNISSPVC